MYLTSGELRELFDVPQRTLDYWCDSGLVTPVVEAEGRGSRRKWSVRDAVKVGVIVALKSEGVPLQTIRKSLDGMWGEILEWEEFRLVYPGAGRIDVAEIRGRVERAFQRRFPEMELPEVSEGE